MEWVHMLWISRTHPYEANKCCNNTMITMRSRIRIGVESKEKAAQSTNWGGVVDLAEYAVGDDWRIFCLICYLNPVKVNFIEFGVCAPLSVGFCLWNALMIMLAELCVKFDSSGCCLSDSLFLSPLRLISICQQRGVRGWIFICVA